MGNKIQIGYGTGMPLSQKKGLYGTRSSGKKMINGGFNGAPTFSFETISDEKWESIFGKPEWKRKLEEKEAKEKADGEAEA